MRIKDLLGIDDEKEAELRAKATFFPSKLISSDQRQGQVFTPFEKVVIEKILTRVRTISKHNIPHPVVARISLSLVCQHGCSNCFYRSGHRQKDLLMNPNGFSKLINFLHNLKVELIDLSGGGEPTLHPEFYRFARMGVDGKFKLNLLTNGVTLSPKIVDLIVGSFSFLRVNLDASEDEVYNLIHRPKDPKEFQRVLKNLDRIISERERRGSRLLVGAKVRLCQANMNFMEQMICLVKDLGLDYIHFQINQKTFQPLIPEQKERVNQLLDELSDKYHPYPVVYDEARWKNFHRRCWLSPINLIIAPSGDLYACPYYAYNSKTTFFGNVFTQTPKKLWFGSEHKSVVEHLKENDCHFQECRLHLYNEFVQKRFQKVTKSVLT